MTSSLAHAERLALCATLTAVGPDAPTLSGAWSTRDLAAHLYTREHHARALPGAFLGGPFARITRDIQQRVHDAHSYEELIGFLSEGPPLLPFGLPGVREAANVLEFFVHHEDVRRANGRAPRADLTSMDAPLWARLRLMQHLLLRRAGTKVVLAWSGTEATTGPSWTQRGPVVTVSGDPRELTLFAWGRQAVADVHIEGPTDATAAVQGARLGP